MKKIQKNISAVFNILECHNYASKHSLINTTIPVRLVNLNESLKVSFFIFTVSPQKYSENKSTDTVTLFLVHYVIRYLYQPRVCVTVYPSPRGKNQDKQTYLHHLPLPVVRAYHLDVTEPLEVLGATVDVDAADGRVVDGRVTHAHVWLQVAGGLPLTGPLALLCPTNTLIVTGPLALLCPTKTLIVTHSLSLLCPTNTLIVTHSLSLLCPTNTLTLTCLLAQQM